MPQDDLDQDNIDPVEERLKSSPLASLKVPASKVPPFKGCPLSRPSIKYLRRHLSHISQYILAADLTTVDRVCEALESEIHTLRAVGPAYLEEMEEGDC